MRLLVAVAMVSIALAGCAGSPDEADPVHGATASATPIPAPEWAIGDSWSFDNMNATGGMSVASIVVTGDGGGDWIVDTSEPETALYNARQEISYLGKVRKADLAGSQGADRVQYFDFPLEANKTWTTKWDDLSVDVHVQHLAAGKAHIQAYDGTRLFAEYEYDAEMKFFSYMTFYDDAGEKAYHMQTTAYSQDYTGTVYRYTLGEPMTFTGAAGAPVEHPFTLADGVNELGITATLSCTGPGGSQLGLQQPDNGQEDVFRAWSPVSQPEWQLQQQCPGDATDTTVIDAMPGPWRLDGVIYAQAGAFTVTVEPRTLEAITV